MTTAEDLARWMLRDLDEAVAGREPRRAFLRQALGRLVPLHAASDSGEWPAPGGEDLRAEVADRLVRLRTLMVAFVADSMYDVDAARDDDLDAVLVLRSTLQYLADDFRGTAADGLVDPEALVEIDDDLKRKLRELTVPADLEAPAGIPESHWWWREAL